MLLNDVKGLIEQSDRSVIQQVFAAWGPDSVHSNFGCSAEAMDEWFLLLSPTLGKAVISATEGIRDSSDVQMQGVPID